MEVITFSPDMDLSSKEAGDVFRLKLYGIEYDVKVVGDDEDPLMFCKDCIFFLQLRTVFTLRIARPVLKKASCLL